ncbi:thaumatin family protein [Kutzneria sp. CA-103260]|uniref:thaumatin family protein n=1 Tax=Kutzneria sp. CA-103260 TaxID=2802641 RepID=UPI001BF0D47D|nr:thaumatin family protein [Kutzneria sp. CA-103260]QUQ63824.1 Thaumatin family protein [Kutzneria sp. CA-103260]
MRFRRLLLAPLLVAAFATPVTVVAAPAASDHTVTFVNQSGQTLWIGSEVNADGSVNFAHLPTLANGQSATVTIPEDRSPNHWRGRFFGRQGCTGSGGSFHCLVGDCGPAADHCTTGQQPVSLAEFNFDRGDAAAPWYDVSYVDAFSVPVTIAPNNAPPPPSGGGPCQVMGCPGDMMQYCPPADLKKNPNTGKPMVCVNPNRDAETDYSKAMSAHCPYAYSWSKGDTTPGNQVMRNCSKCSGFTVTFH